jgi:hypothetical protein
MILVKLIKVAFLLKEFDLSQYFSDGNCNITGIIDHVEEKSPETILYLCSVITDTIQPADIKTIAVGCLVDAMKTISQSNINYPSNKKSTGLDGLLNFSSAKGKSKNKGYFWELWQSLNTIRLSLARVGNFDIGNMELEDCQECLDTNSEWNSKQ